jgi:hypothetical protein
LKALVYFSCEKLHPNGTSYASLLIKTFHRGGAAMEFVGAAFWLFVASVVVAGIWYAYARNRETQKTIRLAIEKGMQPDAAFIDKLVLRESGNPEDYYIGGIICIACGLGLPILGYFIGRIAAEAFFPIAGAGILVGLIGISLILCGVMKGRRGKAIKNGNHRS